MFENNKNYKNNNINTRCIQHVAVNILMCRSEYVVINGNKHHAGNVHNRNVLLMKGSLENNIISTNTI